MPGPLDPSTRRAAIRAADQAAAAAIAPFRRWLPASVADEIALVLVLSARTNVARMAKCIVTSVGGDAAELEAVGSARALALRVREAQAPRRPRAAVCVARARGHRYGTVPSTRRPLRR